MKKSIKFLALLMLSALEPANSQTHSWAIADTAWANSIFQQAVALTESDHGADQDSAFVLFSRMIEVYTSTVGLYHDNIYEALRLQAFIKSIQGDLQVSAALYRQSIEVGRKLFGPRGRPLGSTYAALGTDYGLSGDFEASYYYLNEALETRLQHLGNMHLRTGETYNNLGAVSHFRGDVANAVAYYLKAIEIDEEMLRQGKIEAMDLVTTYRNVSISLSQMGETERSAAFLQRGLDLLGENTADIEMVRMRGRMLRGLAGTYSLSGDNKKSLRYYEDAVAYFKAFSLENSPEIGLCYSNLAIVCNQLNLFEKRDVYLVQAMQVWDSIRLQGIPGPVSDIHFAVSNLKNWGEFDLQNGRLESAKQHSLEALALAQQFSTLELIYAVHLQLASIYAQAGAVDSAEYHFMQAMGGPDQHVVQQYIALISAPGEWALFRFNEARKSDNRPGMEQAWRDWKKFESFLLNRRRKLNGNEDRNYVLTRIRPLIQTALQDDLSLYRAADELTYLQDAFSLAEKIRALSLFEGLQTNNAAQFSGIPDSLIARERALQLDITWTENQIFNKENLQVAATDASVLKLSTKLFDLKTRAELLQKTFETNYPDYYRLKYDLRTEDVASVQRDLLEPDQALLEYFVGDSAVFIFTIQKNDYNVLEIKKDFPLNDWVTQLRRGLTGFFTDPNLADQYEQLSGAYTEAAYNLYQKLVAPIAAKLPKKVVFVSDGILGYVPFEALLAEKPGDPTRWAQHHYLQNDHTVSYCYSATMLREMLQHKHKTPPTLPFLGFAPQYDGDTSILASTFKYVDDMRKDLKPLPYSGEEVYRAAKIMGGQVVVGAEATEAAFVERAGQARVLHLATHGQANDRLGDYCFLVFGGGDKAAKQQPLLYARDIYNLQLNADLVTLSACETGIGELKGGEGIISLARAFAYAGAKSIVTSLWSVSDAKTKDLMLDFYKNIHKKAPKDEALRQAKLEFLKRNKGLAAHPFYWAGFVGIGDMGALK
jgi:CHAT domain-containing protein